MTYLSLLRPLGFAACSLVAVSAFGVETGALSIHGSASATAAYSGKYNYYGDTAGSLDLIQSEVTLNGAHVFDSGLRASAQLYAYELAGYTDLVLDFATLDYAFRPELAVSLGRNKHVLGLHTDSQDIDQVRVFASLPLAFYVRSLRPISAGTDGMTVHGNISLGKAGALDYSLFVGRVDDPKGDMPLLRGQSSLVLVEKIDVNTTYGGAVFWETPVDGLRLGYSYTTLEPFSFQNRLRTKAELTAAGQSLATPTMIDTVYGAGAWDLSGRFAGTPAQSAIEVFTDHVLSAEYVRGDWTYSAEVKYEDLEGANTVPALGVSKAAFNTHFVGAYAMSAYQATDRLGLGAYFCYSDRDRGNQNAASNGVEIARDAAVAASYALTPWWLVKVEAHRIHGLGFLGGIGDVNRTTATEGQTWSYFMFKSTVSF